MAVQGMYDAETANKLAKGVLARAARKAKLDADLKAEPEKEKRKAECFQLDPPLDEGNSFVVHFLTLGLGVILGGLAYTVASDS